MQLKTLAVALFAGLAVALPNGGPPGRGGGGGGGGGGSGGGSGAYTPCNTGLYANPQCCATDVLGLADLDCAVPSSLPTSPSSFRSICATTGQRARCCVLPALGLGVLCQTPIGV